MSNPHLALAQDQLDPEHKWNWTSHDLANISEIIEGNAQATLALAFEARTANLLTLHQNMLIALTNGFTDGEAAFKELNDIAKTIETRLGLGDTK